jgi:hypothetical protein
LSRARLAAFVAIGVVTIFLAGLAAMWLIAGERTVADVLSRVLPGPDINDVLDYLDDGPTPTATPTPAGQD